MSTLAGLNEYEKEQWYTELTPEEKCLFSLIIKYHNYFSSRDKKFRHIVRAIKVVLLLLSMINTIVLGLKTVIPINAQIGIGLILSSMITFVTAVAAYFNFEEYWMRNITIHIELNLLRDNFIIDANAKKIDCANYRAELEKIQRNNIKYWRMAIKRI